MSARGPSGSAGPGPQGARRAGPARLAAAAVLLAILVAGAAWARSGAARWLVRPRAVARCDLLVVPGGGALERLLTAGELVEGGACASLLITGAQSIWDPGRAREVAAMLGRSERIAPPRHSMSTFDDAVISLEVARTRGYRSLLVVTSPYHTRRLSWIFGRVLDGTGIGFGVYPSDSIYMDYARWWENGHGRGVVTSEYAKLWGSGAVATAIVGAACWQATSPSVI